MANRTLLNLSDHDAAVRAAGKIYAQNGRHAWINPNGEKNKLWSGRYIDVIAAETQHASSAWVIEIETEDSVSDSEATTQWKDYDSVYTRWYLAVPVSSEKAAKNLFHKYGVEHCTVTTWRRNTTGTHTFWGLPGIE
jgi:DNA repair protein MmcB-like